MTITVTMSSGVTDMWQYDSDITLTLTLDLNKEIKEKRKRKLNKIKRLAFKLHISNNTLDYVIEEVLSMKYEDER